jgi:hypothetical protein
LPPSGTAGFERSFVSGNKRVPAPPPITIASVCCVVPGGSATFASAGLGGFFAAGELGTSRRQLLSGVRREQHICDGTNFRRRDVQPKERPLADRHQFVRAHRDCLDAGTRAKNFGGRGRIRDRPEAA